MEPLDRTGLEAIAAATYRKTREPGLRHAEGNLPYIARTIRDLDLDGLRGRSAIVVAAGPSLHGHETARRIRAARYPGVVVAADGALGYCLRNGLVPTFVVSLDPHPTRIVRWFGDPELESRLPDDYFRRQDLDPHLGRNEADRNRELLALVNHHGPGVNAILSTSVAPTVTRRVLQAGMPIYWWNPIYDDWDKPNSHTRQIFEMNRVPCMVTGGNCGTAAWVFVSAVLGCARVAVVGMDLSYPPGTPLTSTQYYTELCDLYGDRVAEAYIQVWNPYLQETWFTDPTYWWYRESFLELAAQSPSTTYNCTEGGLLFGDAVQWMSLDDFLIKERETGTP